MCLLFGTKVPDVWYRGACFLIAAWRQQYCWLEATVLLAGGSNRRSAYLVPANAVCYTDKCRILYQQPFSHDFSAIKKQAPRMESLHLYNITG